jgi:cytochrome oxidase Cu insertion factor (SCO1/SenC/PrrC family)
VYDVGGAWRDQTHTVRTLDGLRGTPTLIALMYAHCSSSCPIALAPTKRIAAATPAVRFVLVSLDPQRDTPGARRRGGRDRPPASRLRRYRRNDPGRAEWVEGVEVAP